MLLLTVTLLATSQTPALRVTAVDDSLHVAVSGTGKPVVLIPGLFGTGYGYRHLVPLLNGAGYQSIVIEPLGIGSSSRPEEADYSLSAQADRIGAVLDTLAIDSAVVVAHSLGASIGLRLAYRRPNLVRAVVSIEGGPAEAATTRSFRKWLSLAPLSKLFNGATLMQKMIYRDLIRSSADTTWISEDLVHSYVAGDLVDFGATMDAYRGMARAEEPERLQDHLAEIRCPVVLLVGGVPHKGAPGEEEIAVLAAGLPRFVVDTVPNAGHFIQEERPEMIVVAIDRVLAGGGPRAVP